MAQPAWRTRRTQILILVVVCVGLLVSIGLLSLSIGTPRLSLHDLWIIAAGGGTLLSRVVVTQLRLPRLVLALLTGAMLACLVLFDFSTVRILRHLYFPQSTLLGKNIQPIHAPPRAGDVRLSMADINQARTDLGYAPQISFHEGLRRTLEAQRQGKK